MMHMIKLYVIIRVYYVCILYKSLETLRTFDHISGRSRSLLTIKIAHLATHNAPYVVYCFVQGVSDINRELYWQ